MQLLSELLYTAVVYCSNKVEEQLWSLIVLCLSVCLSVCLRYCWMWSFFFKFLTNWICLCAEMCTSTVSTWPSGTSVTWLLELLTRHHRLHSAVPWWVWVCVCYQILMSWHAVVVTVKNGLLVLTYYYQCQLCLSACVGFLSPSVCWFVRSITHKQMIPKC